METLFWGQVRKLFSGIPLWLVMSSKKSIWNSLKSEAACVLGCRTTTASVSAFPLSKASDTEQHTHSHYYIWFWGGVGNWLVLKLSLTHTDTHAHVLSCVCTNTDSNVLMDCGLGSFHVGLRRLIVCVLKWAVWPPQIFCFLCHIRHQTAQTRRAQEGGCWRRRQDHRQAERERERAVVSLHGIKAGYNSSLIRQD